MTVDELPVTGGSLARDDVDREYCAVVRYRVVRWRPMGDGHTSGRLITPEELAARGPAVLYVAPGPLA